MVRKIIHLDMDCFYAAVELRDRPELLGKPIAVGGSRTRGVVTTCSYEARKFGVHSAMSGVRARKLCPQLIFLPVNFDKYRAESKKIRSIMRKYTEVIEPLSLDEAYLDVTHSPLHKNSATLTAKALKDEIYKETGLKASVGVAPNKFLAKVASDWDKPDGLTVIPPHKVAEFVIDLPLNKIPGVGPVTQKKLKEKGLSHCRDVQKMQPNEMQDFLGKFGLVLYERSFGRDDRPLVVFRERKSLSVENTFEEDLKTSEEIDAAIEILFSSLQNRLSQLNTEKNNSIETIKGIFVKVKFSDFSLTTKQVKSASLSSSIFIELSRTACQRKGLPVRLLGIGVAFNRASLQKNLLCMSSREGIGSEAIFFQINKLCPL